MAAQWRLVVWLAAILVFLVPETASAQQFPSQSQALGIPPSPSAAPAGRQEAIEPLSGRSPRSVPATSGVGQAPSVPGQGTSSASSAPGDATSAPATTPNSRQATSAEALISAILQQQPATVAGKPLVLRNALAAGRSAEAQQSIAHAYWQLSEAQGRFRLCADRVNDLQRLRPQPADQAAWQAALTAAQAELADAQVELVSAQYRLAQQCGLSLEQGPPLAADMPHTGTYYTHYEEFASQNLPAYTGVLARVLPVRHEVINARAASVVAAQDAFVAARQAYQLGECTFDECLDALARRHRQYVELLCCVCQYNHEIADYAIGVAGMQRDVDRLVRMLIRTSHSATAPQSGSKIRQLGADSRQVDSHRVQPAIPRGTTSTGTGRNSANFGAAGPVTTGEENRATMDTGAASGRLEPLGRGEPHLAPPPPDESPSGSPTEPAAAEASSSVPSSPTPAGDSVPQVPVPQRGGALRKPSSEPPAPAQPAAPNATEQSAASTGGAEQSEGWKSAPTPIRVNKASTAADDEAIVAEQYYPGLSQAGSARQAKALGHALFARWPLPDVQAQAIRLDECLQRVAPAKRLQAVEAYWYLARETAAVLARVEQVSHFEQLEVAVFDRRSAAGGAESMLYLRAARLAAEAELRQARLRLQQAQSQLAVLLGTDQSENLFASTAPHVGPYVLRYQALSADLRSIPEVARLAVEIPAYWNAVRAQATALVEADRNRATATVDYKSNGQSIARVLAAIDAQQQQTSRLIDMVCRYNRAIGQYALRVVPNNLPPRQLAGTLVLLR